MEGEENKTCAMCTHVHTNEDGTCECGCVEGKAEVVADDEAGGEPAM